MPKAYVFTRIGGPETEALVDVDQLRPGPGQLLVAVRAAGASAEAVERLGGARDTAVLDAVADLVVRGALDPYVTSTFPLDRAGEALRTVEEGHARGKTVITVEVAR